jgi:hypothetical protein
VIPRILPVVACLPSFEHLGAEPVLQNRIYFWESSPRSLPTRRFCFLGDTNRPPFFVSPLRASRSQAPSGCRTVTPVIAISATSEATSNTSTTVRPILLNTSQNPNLSAMGVIGFSPPSTPNTSTLSRTTLIGIAYLANGCS